jgi:hypothetical protein
MKPSRVTLAVVVALILAAPAAHADFTVSTTLLGINETPPNNSQASGFATFTYDTANDVFHYNLSWTDLTTPATAAHLHLAPVGVPGPIILPIAPIPSTTSGSIVGGLLTAADIVNQGTTGLTTIAQIAAQIQAGNVYVNVHDSEFPAGEIRGQLAAVPEPGGLLLLTTGAAGLAAVTWRRRTPA